MNPNNIRIRIRSRKHYSLTSGLTVLKMAKLARSLPTKWKQKCVTEKMVSFHMSFLLDSFRLPHFFWFLFMPHFPPFLAPWFDWEPNKMWSWEPKKLTLPFCFPIYALWEPTKCEPLEPKTFLPFRLQDLGFFSLPFIFLIFWLLHLSGFICGLLHERE